VTPKYGILKVCLLYRFAVIDSRAISGTSVNDCIPMHDAVPLKIPASGSVLTVAGHRLTAVPDMTLGGQQQSAQCLMQEFYYYFFLNACSLLVCCRVAS